MGPRRCNPRTSRPRLSRISDHNPPRRFPSRTYHTPTRTPARKRIQIRQKILLRARSLQQLPRTESADRGGGAGVGADESDQASRIRVSSLRREPVRREPYSQCRLTRPQHLPLLRLTSPQKGLWCSPSGFQDPERAPGSNATVLPHSPVTYSAQCSLTILPNNVFKTWSSRIFDPC